MSARTIRLQTDSARSSTVLRDALTADTIFLYKGSAVGIQVGLQSDGRTADGTLVATLYLSINPIATKSASPAEFETSTASINDIDGRDWEDGGLPRTVCSDGRGHRHYSGRQVDDDLVAEHGRQLHHLGVRQNRTCRRRSINHASEHSHSSRHGVS